MLGGMKTLWTLPPLAALLGMGLWNTRQVLAISSTTAAQSDLREKISKHAATSKSATEMNRREVTQAAVTPGKHLADRRWIAEQVEAMDTASSLQQLRATVLFQQQLDGLSAGEMIALLDSAPQLGLSDSGVETLQSLIVARLTKTDPEQMVRRYGENFDAQSETVNWQLSTGLQKWAEKDLPGARAWLDQQVAAGKLESKTLDGLSQMRLEFETGLLPALLSSDPKAAASRIAALPAEQRLEALQGMDFLKTNSAQQKAYAEILRQQLSADDQESAFSQIASEYGSIDGGFQKLDAFLDSVSASPAERATAAKDAAIIGMEHLAGQGKLSAASFDTLHTWLGKQAPEDRAEVTGQALVNAVQQVNGFSFSQAATLAEKFSRSGSDGDTLLETFLSSSSSHASDPTYLKLVGLIQDPEKRKTLTLGGK